MALAPSLWGPQRIANVVTANVQHTSTVAGLTNGAFVIGWLSIDPIMTSDSGDALRLQGFDGFGARVGVNLVLDTSNALFSGDSLGTPDIAADASGAFTVAWTHWVGATNAIPNDIFAQSFAATLAPLSAKTTAAHVNFPVNLYSDSHVSVGPAGLRFVGYSDYGDPGGDIAAREFSGVGLAPQGAAFTVNTTTAGAQLHGDSSVSAGRFLVAWDAAGGGGRDIVARAYDATTGAPTSGEIAVAATTSDEANPAVAGLGGGAFAVAYERDGDIYVSTVAADNSVTAAARANTSLAGAQTKPAIVGLADGSFFVAWSDAAGASGADIRGQMFSATLAPIGSEITLTGAGDQVDVAIGALSDGRIVASWTEQAGSPNGDGSSSAIAYALIETRGAFISGGPGADTLIGTDGGLYADNFMVGGGGDDVIYGLSGDDFMIGGDGDDLLIGGAGRDLMDSGSGVDTLYGGDGDDYLQVFLGQGAVLVGEAGDDTVFGGYGNDYVVGGEGRDIIVGVGGRDQLYGGEGDDYVIAGDQGAAMVGGAGDDQLWGNQGPDYIVGDDGADLLVGSYASDYLFGGDGADTLYGGTQTDYIYTNAGNDFVWTDDVGYRYTDYVYVGGGTGVDTIADFTPGGGDGHDVLVVSPASGITNFAQFKAAIVQAGIYAVVVLSGGDQVYLYNVDASQLTPDNVLFF